MKAVYKPEGRVVAQFCRDDGTKILVGRRIVYKAASILIAAGHEIEFPEDLSLQDASSWLRRLGDLYAGHDEKNLLVHTPGKRHYARFERSPSEAPQWVCWWIVEEAAKIVAASGTAVRISKNTPPHDYAFLFYRISELLEAGR